MKSFLLAAALVTVAGVLTASGQDATVTLRLDKPQWLVSKYLTGSHFCYGYEADWIYEDDTVIEWMKRAKVGVIRYPGGTVTMNWHWDDLNGYSFDHQVKKLTGKLTPADSWNPKYVPLPKRHPKEYMDVDEYIAVCRKVGADAMLGINIRSGAFYRTDNDSKDETRRLAEYCKAKGYDIKFFYMGNEGYAKGFYGKKYARAIDDYAAIVKKVYPEARIIADWKYGPRKKKRFEHSLELIRMSKAIDIMEYHEKWGNDWGIYSGKTREEWLAQKPFLYKGQFSEFYERFEEHNRKLGRDVKHAHNEWGIGGMQDCEGPYDYALLTADLFIELFRHPTYMAAGWNLNMGTKWSRVFIAEDSKVTLMPPALVYEMVAKAMGSHIIPVEVTGNDAVYGFATRNEETREVQIFLINKSDSDAELRFAPKGGGLVVTAAERLVSPGGIEKEQFKKPATALKLNAMSFTRIVGSSRQ